MREEKKEKSRERRGVEKEKRRERGGRRETRERGKGWWGRERKGFTKAFTVCENKHTHMQTICRTH